MVTNLIATIVIAVTTNSYNPMLYPVRHSCLVYGCTQKYDWVADKTCDTDGRDYLGNIMPPPRADMSTKITEVWERANLYYEVGGQKYNQMLWEKLLDKQVSKE